MASMNGYLSFRCRSRLPSLDPGVSRSGASIQPISKLQFRLSSPRAYNSKIFVLEFLSSSSQHSYSRSRNFNFPSKLHQIQTSELSVSAQSQPHNTPSAQNIVQSSKFKGSTACLLDHRLDHRTTKCGMEEQALLLVHKTDLLASHQLLGAAILKVSPFLSLHLHPKSFTGLSEPSRPTAQLLLQHEDNVLSYLGMTPTTTVKRIPEHICKEEPSTAAIRHHRREL